MKQLIYIMLISMLLAGCGRSGAHVAKSGSDSVVAKFTLPEANMQTPEQRVYFPFASDSLLPEAVEKIGQNIEWLRANIGSYIILEGHCDEVGQSDFNLQLGDRRARTVKAYMIERGISPERIIMVVSYGSTRPLNPGHRVEDLRDNRRVEFVLR